MKEELNVDELKKDAGDLKDSLLYGSKDKAEGQATPAEVGGTPEGKTGQNHEK